MSILFPKAYVKYTNLLVDMPNGVAGHMGHTHITKQQFQIASNVKRRGNGLIVPAFILVTGSSSSACISSLVPLAINENRKYFLNNAYLFVFRRFSLMSVYRRMLTCKVWFQ